MLLKVKCDNKQNMVLSRLIDCTLHCRQTILSFDVEESSLYTSAYSKLVLTRILLFVTYESTALLGQRNLFACSVEI